MHSLFITLLEMITWAKEGARCRFIQVNNCSPGRGRHLYCTVLYCTVLVSWEGRHCVACRGNYNKEIEMA